MPKDPEKSITRLYTLLAKLPLEDYLSSKHFADFCRRHDLTDTWKEHLDTARDRPELYGKDSTKNAFILFFHHLFQTRSCEFLMILTAFLQDFREWNNGFPLPCAALQKECVRMGFPDTSVEAEFSKVRNKRGS